MIKRYLQQTFAQLWAQPLLGLITVIGTALSVFLLMIAFMMQQVHTAPFPPESNRNRMLHMSWLNLIDRETKTQSGGNDFLSERVAKEGFKDMQTPEAVAIYSPVFGGPVSLPRQDSEWVDIRGTDAGFWQVFNFTFTDGAPYTEAESEAGLWRVVITESVARKLYGEVKVSGREILVNGYPAQVCGVVKNVSSLASWAYAQVWIPYRTLGIHEETWAGGMTGVLQVTILAHRSADFPKIRKESEALRLKISEGLGKNELNYRNQPDTQEKASLRYVKAEEPDMGALHRRQWLIYTVFLIVPAINLVSMTQGRFRRRKEEIGIRRAFGATRGDILRQVWGESLLITLFAGLLGLLMCFLFSVVAGDFLFGTSQLSSPLHQEVSVSWQLLFRPAVFGYTLFFCFILNLLSSGVPAWKASRSHLVNSLGGN